MRIEKSLEVRTEVSMKYRDVFKTAEMFKLPFDKVLERIQKINSEIPKGTPKWVRYYLSGYYNHWLDNIRSEKIEFCYIYNGEKYSSNSNSDKYYQKHGITPKEMNQNHEGFASFWKNSNKLWTKIKKRT